MRRYPNREDVRRIQRTIRRELRSEQELVFMTHLPPQIVSCAVRLLLRTGKAEPVFVTGMPVMWRFVE